MSLKFVPKGPIDNNPALVLDNGLAPNRRQAIIWTNADSIHWRIYAALGWDELTHLSKSKVKGRSDWKQILRYTCSGMVWVDIPEFAPLRKSWIHVMSSLEELERSDRVSTGSPLNQACETRLGPFGTGLERQLDEFPVCRTLGLAINNFSAIGCFSAVSCFSAAQQQHGGKHVFALCFVLFWELLHPFSWPEMLTHVQSGWPV